MIRRPIIAASLLVATSLVLLGTCMQRGGESAGDFQRRVLSQRSERFQDVELNAAHQALQSELVAIDGAFAGDAGIAVVEVASGAVMQSDGRVPFPQQSVSKLWVAMTALDLVDKGKLGLQEPVSIGRQDLTLFHQPIRAIVLEHGSFRTNFGELLHRAITESDNTANDRLLLRVGGPQAVEGYLRRQSISGVQFGTDERTKQSEIAGLDWHPSYSVGRAFYDARDRVPQEIRQQAFSAYLADPIDGASATGMATALARLARGELLSGPSTRLLLGTMAQTKSGPNRLKGSVPEGWSMAHKTGTGQVLNGTQSGYNDVGILTAPDGTQFAIAVLIGSTRSSYAERFAMMQAVTSAVVRYHEGAPSPERAVDRSTS
ncbi:MAG: serine hydrolase [Citromicrobium sp.]|nr:MAG: serine hydrolase [Citromicrobium sp.]